MTTTAYKPPSPLLVPSWNAFPRLIESPTDKSTDTDNTNNNNKNNNEHTTDDCDDDAYNDDTYSNYVHDSLDGYNNYAYGDNDNDDDNNDSYASSFSGED